MNVLGLKLGAKPQTDEEYIQSVREWMQHPRRAAAVNASQAALLCIVVFSCLFLGDDLILRIAASEDPYWGAFAAGMMFGVLTGFYLGWAVCPTILELRSCNFNERRAERLTLVFHDEWKNRKAGGAPDAATTCERAEAEGRKILGIRISPSRKTDEQYVESIRKKVRRSKWLVIFQIITSVLLLACPITFFMLWKSVSSWGPTDGGWFGFAVGVLWGVVGGGAILYLFLGPLEGFARIIHGCRVERLMLKYYDELNGRQESGGAAQGSVDR